MGKKREFKMKQWQSSNPGTSNNGYLSSGEWTNTIKVPMNSMSNRAAGGQNVSGSYTIADFKSAMRIIL